MSKPDKHDTFDFSPFYTVYPLNVSVEVKALLAKRIADAERLLGISGQSNAVYHEACPPNTAYLLRKRGR